MFVLDRVVKISPYVGVRTYFSNFKAILKLNYTRNLSTKYLTMNDNLKQVNDSPKIAVGL